ncbi:MAG: fumarylacetoacetase [Candidatus Solibacter usitatus]|nr:fumarylacetoacetase [Candidatus Solibacter usitatus]
MIDETHDPARRSWVESGNDPATDFPIQNLPLGVFSRPGESPRAGAAIGDQILDLRAAGLYGGVSLNGLMAMGVSLRRQIGETLDAGASPHPEWLVPIAGAALHLPAHIGDYTDFYAGIHHATRVGRLFRPDNPLMPNYKYVPIGYHGRASSIVVSGAPVRRPSGQIREDESAPPVFGPSRRLDFELEAGFLAGPGNRLGEPVPMAEAESHIFGFCLVNDWSARDIQKWEYQPLGPFLAKSFATTISPWVVTREALEPFRSPAFTRPEGDPPPLPYLSPPGEGLDLTLEVWLNGERISRASTRDLYWTFAQMLVHHASNGCNLRPGDLIASGTVSGTAPDARGCLLEMQPRPFLQDGDEVLLRGYGRREGFARIGFGECKGVILPAR